MFRDANQLEPGTVLESDLCIVGGGAAGISIALEFANTGANVVLLEGGGLKPDAATQDLYAGSARRSYISGSLNIGSEENAYLTASRLRYFGGSTNHWGGICRPLDELDFVERPWVPNSGWPIRLADLEPYYARANTVMGLQSFAEPGDAEAPRLYGADRFREFEYKYFHRRVVLFGDRYLNSVEKAGNVAAYLHANVTNIQSNRDGTAVDGVDVSTLAGLRFRVHSRVYILACGGIENPRLLLASRGVHQYGLGNATDRVGRYFMEHPHLYPGHVCFPVAEKGMDRFAMRLNEKTRNDLFPVICPSPALQRAHQLLNFGAELHDVRRQFRNWSPLSRNIARFTEGLHRFTRQMDPAAGGGKDPGGFYGQLFARTEHAPNPDSRVSLTRERDALGVPRVDLDWRLTGRDVDSIKRTTALLAREFGSLALGRASVTVDEAEPDRISVGMHHMGTTRMHEDPRHGVVDRDCRVHGLANLYVAGSSVFPTSGFANPTYTLVALALRLADHIKSKVSAG